MLCSSGGLRNPQERDVADKGFQLKVNSEDNIELILLQDLEMISEQRPLDFYELEELWSLSSMISTLQQCKRYMQALSANPHAKRPRLRFCGT
jgi:hypothetical protein